MYSLWRRTWKKNYQKYREKINGAIIASRCEYYEQGGGGGGNHQTVS